jgi:hypothetical protein
MATNNTMRTPVNDEGKAPQSEQGYQRSIAQPSAAADNNPPEKATSTKAKGRSKRYMRTARKSRRRRRRPRRRTHRR